MSARGGRAGSGPTRRDPPPPARGSPAGPRFSGAGHLKKPCPSCRSWGTGSDLGRGLLRQPRGLPTGGRPWVGWATEPPAPKPFWGYPRGRLLLQVGVRPPLLPPLPSISSFLGPPGQPRLSGGASGFRRPPRGSDKVPLKRGLVSGSPAASRGGVAGGREAQAAWIMDREMGLGVVGWAGASPQVSSMSAPITHPGTPGPAFALAPCRSLRPSLPSSLRPAQRVPAPKQLGQGHVLLLSAPNPCRGDTPLAPLPSNFPFAGLPATLMGPV